MKSKVRMNTKDELLLSKFIDGECSLFERFRANRVLTRSPEAPEFLENLKTTKQYLKQTLSSSHYDLSGEDTLWLRVSNRIEEEERAVVFLGERAKDRNTSRLLKEYSQGIFGNSGMMWGGVTGTAVVAAALMVFVSIKDESSPSLLANSQVSSRLTTPAGGAAGRRPVILERSLGSAMSVDWMRSNGPVRVTEDPHDGAPMIWISRRSSALQTRSRRSNPVIIDRIQPNFKYSTTSNGIR